MGDLLQIGKPAEPDVITPEGRGSDGPVGGSKHKAQHRPALVGATREGHFECGAFPPLSLFFLSHRTHSAALGERKQRKAAESAALQNCRVARSKRTTCQCGTLR